MDRVYLNFSCLYLDHGCLLLYHGRVCLCVVEVILLEVADFISDSLIVSHNFVLQRESTVTHGLLRQSSQMQVSKFDQKGGIILGAFQIRQRVHHSTALQELHSSMQSIAIDPFLVFAELLLLIVKQSIDGHPITSVSPPHGFSFPSASPHLC